MILWKIITDCQTAKQGRYKNYTRDSFIILLWAKKLPKFVFQIDPDPQTTLFIRLPIIIKYVNNSVTMH